MLNIGMLFKHEFYQDYLGSEFDMYYRKMRRKATAIFRIEKVVKPGLYKVCCIKIQSNENFVMLGYTGGEHHQYYKGDVFLLRKHKGKDNDWFDVRQPGLNYTEHFKLL